MSSLAGTTLLWWATVLDRMWVLNPTAYQHGSGGCRAGAHGIRDLARPPAEWRAKSVAYGCHVALLSPGSATKGPRIHGILSGSLYNWISS